MVCVGCGEDLFFGTIIQSELMASLAHEDGVPGAPILFAAHKDHLLSALFAGKDDLLGITPHVTSFASLG